MKRVFWVVILLAVIVAGYAINQTDKVTLSEDKETPDGERPAIIKGVNIYEYKDNQLSWIFQIAGARIYEKKGQTFFTQLFGKIPLDSVNSKYIEVKAVLGVIEKIPHLMKLDGGVFMSLPDQSQIETEYLVINLKDKLVFNDQPVTLRSTNGSINGHSLNYDIKGEVLKLKQIRMELLLE